ncbi:MAG TPA: M15 family metallopeptidase [Actinomycetota bacterium]|nr:M15 family metallopeptidase [Actinomycetota bacterium]
MTARGAVARTAWAAFGALACGAVILGAESIGREPPAPATPPPLVTPAPDETPAPQETPPPAVTSERSGKVLLAWATGAGLPPRTERILEDLRGVAAVTLVDAGIDWLHASFDADGSLLDRPSPPMAIPVEIASVNPADYAAFVPAGERDHVLTLGPRDVLLPETSAELRRASPGSVLRLEPGRFTVSGILSDAAAGGYEAVVSDAAPREWPSTETYALIRTKSPDLRSRVRKTITSLLEPGDQLQMRAEGENPFLRYGDAVLPQLIVKSVFGEFAAAPRPDGFLDVDPAWKRRNVKTARVPLLGEVTCHRALFPQLRRALAQARAANLSFAVDPDDFGGCYSPRFINRNPAGRLSHHSWGIAVDVNVAANAYGTKADQDPRLVRIMEAAGFTWGGRWVVPDGMHFEWSEFPGPDPKG